MDDSNQNPKLALADRLKDAKNILVTVNNGPTIDQLAACLGLTIWLNKVGKHATAVFSGEVPSTLEFLQPDDTLEKNTDSLRDFIISLDKSKADKLRYKVEDSVVKVFVTPYRTSLTADDLEFSQGDFNVDMVIALGVHNQNELDSSITAHGRILHDATVATVTIGDQPSELGSIMWHDSQTSSLSELIVELANSVDQSQIDSQIATALLTGVVAETERFSNGKTTPQTMSVSAQLMSAGANQQLVATKLEKPVAEPEPVTETVTEQAESAEPTPPANNDGSLSIDHVNEPAPEAALPEPEYVPPAFSEPVIEDVKETSPDEPEVTHFAEQGPENSGTLTANAQPEDETAEPSTDPLSQAEDSAPLLDHATPDLQPTEEMQPAPPNWMPPQPWMSPPAEPVAEPELPPVNDASVEAVEVNDPTLPLPEPEQPVAETPDIADARSEVEKAVEAAYVPAPEPVQALNALPIDLNQPTEDPEPVIEPAAPIPVSNTEFNPAAFNVMNDPEVPVVQPMTSPADPNQPVDSGLTGAVEQPFTMPLPSALTPPPANPTPPTSVEFDPMAPPPVPPPFAPRPN